MDKTDVANGVPAHLRSLRYWSMRIPEASLGAMVPTLLRS